jgi:hypothetical protein
MLKFIIVIVLILQLKLVAVNERIYLTKKLMNFSLQTFDATTDDSVALHFEDNVIDGKFSSFAKMNLRLSGQSNIELLPSRSISSLQYERLIEVILLLKLAH